MVATLPVRADAGRLALELRRTFALGPSAVRTATIAAFGEPYDGHALIAAWIPDEDEDEARELLDAAGATVHEEPWTVPGS
jgi:hypothetical protein